MGSSEHRQGCLLFDVVHSKFSLLTMALPTLQGALKNVLERLLWPVTCLNHASFRLLPVARRGSCGPTRELILLCTQSLVLCSKSEMRRSFLRHFISKVWKFFSETAGRVHVSEPRRKEAGVKSKIQYRSLLLRLVALV